MTRCHTCGELVGNERDVCPGCGTPIPDESRPFERRLRFVLIALLVLGALALVASFLSDWLAGVTD